MEPTNPKNPICHIVAVPFPGRGHINPMMNLCKLISSKQPNNNNFLITFVVTEEWLGFIGSEPEPEPKPNTIQFATIPNVIPSELVRGKDYVNFLEAVMTNMEAPFDRLLDQLPLPVTNILCDLVLRWSINVGKRRNISVSAFRAAAATSFPLSAAKYNRVIPESDNGVIPENRVRVLRSILESLSSCASKAQCLIFNSVYELETEAFTTLKSKFNIPIYAIPCIPYFRAKEDGFESESSSYFDWLDSQAKGSVLYISQGSFLSLTEDQMNEISSGVRASGAKYLWVGRRDNRSLKEDCGDDNGIVVTWCDQLRVLCHPSVGGFWTHCGWNSTLEAIFAGVPMLTFPFGLDQHDNSDMVVEKWRVGWKVNSITRDEISGLIKRFMDAENSERNEMIRRIQEISRKCKETVAKNGSSDKNLQTFISNIL